MSVQGQYVQWWIPANLHVVRHICRVFPWCCLAHSSLVAAHMFARHSDTPTTVLLALVLIGCSGGSCPMADDYLHTCTLATSRRTRGCSLCCSTDHHVLRAQLGCEAAGSGRAAALPGSALQGGQQETAVTAWVLVLQRSLGIRCSSSGVSG